MRHNGFTLIEFAIAVLIVGILLVVVLPKALDSALPRAASGTNPLFTNVLSYPVTDSKWSKTIVSPRITYYIYTPSRSGSGGIELTVSYRYTYDSQTGAFQGPTIIW